jgi:predicted Zn-dependent peptidase
MKKFIGLAIGLLIIFSSCISLKAQPTEEIELSIGKVTRVVLDNGLTLLIKDSDSPTTIIIFAVKKGSLNEKKPGTAFLTAQCLLEGTKKRTAKEIATEIETHGGTLSASCDYHASYLVATTLSEFTYETLEIMSDCILNPTFPKDVVERKKNEAIDSLNLIKDNPLFCLILRFQEVFYENHPYGTNPLGTKDAIPSITRNDLNEFYQEYYTSDNSILCVVGKVSVEDIIKTTESLSDNYKRGLVPRGEIPSLSPKNKNVKITEKGNANSSYVAIDFEAPGVSLAEKDWAAVSVLSVLLGGGGSSRLFKEIREDRGLVYSIQAAYSGQIGPTTLIILFWCGPENVEEVTSLTLKEVEKIKKEGVSKKEVSETIKFIEENTKLLYENEIYQASILVSYEILDFGVRFFDKQIEEIKEVTAKDIKEVANEYLDFYTLLELKP